MSNLSQIVDLLEVRISKVLSKYAVLQDENVKLRQQVEILGQEIAKQSQLINEINEENESLKIAKAIVGNKEETHLTKLKINTLVREIDKCIAQLSE